MPGRTDLNKLRRIIICIYERYDGRPPLVKGIITYFGLPLRKFFCPLGDFFSFSPYTIEHRPAGQFDKNFGKPANGPLTIKSLA